MGLIARVTSNSKVANCTKRSRVLLISYCMSNHAIFLIVYDVVFIKIFGRGRYLKTIRCQ